MSQPIISANNLYKSYPLYDNQSDRLKETLMPWKSYHRDFFATNGVSFEIFKGDHLGIIGVNGSGKSTLLKILCGILTPTSGEFKVDGEIAALLELGAGFNIELTGRENIKFMCQLSNHADLDLENLINEIINFADIGEFIDQPVKTYSSGMFVRLAFAQSVISKPEILIVDEALAVGDVFFQQKCIRKMEEFRNDGTVVYVSHDLITMGNICNKIIWLEHGKIKMFGDAKTVCNAYNTDSFLNFGSSYVSVQQDEEIDSKPTSLQKHNFSSAGKFAEKDAVGPTDGEIIDAYIKADSDVFSGGEEFTLCIKFATKRSFTESLIVGFVIKNRLGIEVFGTNTEDEAVPIKVKANDIHQVDFTIDMPYLMTGEYTISVSLAEGTCQKFRQLHFVHDALLFSTDKEKDRAVLFYHKPKMTEFR